jgi:hypothetical protein
MSSYIPQGEKEKFSHGIEPSTTIHAPPLCHRIAWENFFFNIYTTKNEKMTSQNKLV